jgi:hypothetical protein
VRSRSAPGAFQRALFGEPDYLATLVREGDFLAVADGSWHDRLKTSRSNLR